MVKTWMNFGGWRITDGINTATFMGGSGRIRFAKLESSLIADDDYIASRLRGYRPYIETNRGYTLQNDEDAVTQTKALAAILSNLVSETENKSATVYPRYDPDEDVNLSYECKLDSDVSPKDIARTECGTVIDLKWIARGKIVTIPSIFSGETDEAWTDEFGNDITDDNNDTITVSED